MLILNGKRFNFSCINRIDAFLMFSGCICKNHHFEPMTYPKFANPKKLEDPLLIYVRVGFLIESLKQRFMLTLHKILLIDSVIKSERHD